MADIGGAVRRAGRRGLWIAAGFAAVGAVAAVVGLWHLPSRMYPADQAEARAALQGGLLTAAAALTAVAGALIALDETRRSNANTHVRELYATAIGQLGADSLDVRLGGIYALERIAVDSVADQRTIVEVLSAFVRVHSTDPALRPTAPADGEPPAPPMRPAVDVHAAVTVLARLPIRRGVPRADLTGADLTGPAALARLQATGGNLHAVDLSGADLTGAQLAGANLTGATLGWANLTDAQLGKANLTGAWLGDGSHWRPAGQGEPHWRPAGRGEPHRRMAGLGEHCHRRMAGLGEHSQRRRAG